MPASGFDCYLQDARNNFDAVRPAPIPTDGSVLLGQSQNIHISTNCYYGYHGTKNTGNMNVVSTDCEMMEVGNARGTPAMQTTAKKRSAGVADCPQSKRLRQGKIILYLIWNLTESAYVDNKLYRFKIFQSTALIRFNEVLFRKKYLLYLLIMCMHPQHQISSASVDK